MTKKDQTFESSLAALNRILDELESGELALDDALGKFEDGVKLVASMRKELARVDGRIEELLGSGETRKVDEE